MSPWYFRPRNEAEAASMEIRELEHEPKNHNEGKQYFLNMWLNADYQFVNTEAFLVWLDAVHVKVAP